MVQVYFVLLSYFKGGGGQAIQITG